MTGLSLILDQMLPGDTDRNLPSFDMLKIDLDHHFTKEEFDLSADIVGPNNPIADINALLKSLRADRQLCSTRRQSTDPLFHKRNRDSFTTEWAEYPFPI